MRGIILISLLVGAIQAGYGQDILVGRTTVNIEKVNSKYSINLDGDVVLDNIDSIGVLKNSDRFYFVKKEGKYGIYSDFGEAKIPVIFEKIDRIFNEYWLVRSKQKFGIYNIYSGSSLPAEYDYIKFSGTVGAEFIVKKDDKYGVVDYKWKVVAPITYDFARPLGGQIELVSGNEKSYLIDRQIVNRTILINKTFQSYGHYPSDTKTYYVFEEKNKYGIINSKGEIVWQPKYDDIVPRRRGGNKTMPENIFLVKRNNKWGVTNLSDSIIAPIEYQSIDLGSDDYLLVETNGLKQFFDLKNKRVVEGITFQKYYNLPKYSRIEKNGFETLIDNETMKLIFPFQYQFLLYNDEAKLFSAGVYGKYGIVDVNNKPVIPLSYDEPIFISCGNKIVVRKGNQYGVIDTKNNVLIPFSARSIVAYSDGYERAKENSFETEKLDCNLQ